MCHKDGFINLPHMSAELADKFGTINIEQILSEVNIEENQKQNIKTRFQTIKNANKTAKNNSNFLVKNEYWSTQTIKNELEYQTNGKTYFQKLCAFNMADWWI